MNVALRQAMTRDAFFEWAEAREGRYEFDGLQPVAMTGGTNAHAVPSVRRYVLVEQGGMALTVHSRQQGEPWVTTPLVEGDVLELPEVGIEVPVAAMYEGIDLETA